MLSRKKNNFLYHLFEHLSKGICCYDISMYFLTPAHHSVRQNVSYATESLCCPLLLTYFVCIFLINVCCICLCFFSALHFFSFRPRLITLAAALSVISIFFYFADNVSRFGFSIVFSVIVLSLHFL